MTGRERLNNIINLKPTDRVPWTTLVCPVTCSVMPENIRKMPTMDFYRHIGCDIFQFGNYGLKDETQGIKYPCRFSMSEIEIEEYTDTDGYVINKRKTKWGELVVKSKNNHPVKYPVETINDVRILTNIWLNSKYEEDEAGCEKDYKRMDEMIRNDGIYVPITEPSPVQMLLEIEMGTENFYYLLADYKEEIDELINVMNRVRMEEYRIIAEKMPYSACIPLENTSSTYMSPDIYRQYSLPIMRDFVELMHKNGKKAIIHMCGLLKNLLPEIKETGLDGIHALTTAPIGNMDFEYALDMLGDKLIIMGLLDSSVLHRPGVTTEEIHQLLKRTLTPKVRESNFILWFPADGIPTPIDKFYVVREWMDKNGGK